MNKVFVILGPTSSGKTSLSLDLCKKYNGEIISADSRQIYKYMDIGTGKVPTSKEEGVTKKDLVWNFNGINIWGYDLLKPDVFFSSYEYTLFALPKITELIEKEKTVFITGGTGFYIDTLTGKVTPSLVEPDFGLREELKNLTADELVKRLKLLDEEVLTKIDTQNPIRLIRAIEKASKKIINVNKLPYITDAKFYLIGLNAPRELLFSRADSWAEKIWNNGLIEETESLLKMGYKKSPKLKGLVYKSVVDFLDKKLGGVEALQRIKFDLHGYIRRQQTYFNKNKDIAWFDISKENYPKNIYNFIEEQIKNG
jgi:tRNA dimethylallyltransferase